MIEIAQLAQETVAVLAPLLPLAKELATKAGDATATEAGKKLLGWLSGAFQGKSTKLDRAIEKPDDPVRLKALELEIGEMAEDDSFRTRLAELVRAAKASGPVTTGTQTATITGDNTKLAQNFGNNNQIHIG